MGWKKERGQAKKKGGRHNREDMRGREGKEIKRDKKKAEKNKGGEEGKSGKGIRKRKPGDSEGMRDGNQKEDLLIEGKQGGRGKRKQYNRGRKLGK